MISDLTNHHKLHVVSAQVADDVSLTYLINSTHQYTNTTVNCDTPLLTLL